MDENKKKKDDGQVSDVENDDLQQEMEDLAKIFKEELEKAKKENDDLLSIDNLEVEGYDPKKVSKKKTEEKEMCEYCGERPRGTEKNPKSPYCKHCEELLEKYPYDYRGVIAALAIFCIMVGAIFCFAINTPIFSMMKKADKALDEGKLYSAITDYELAFEYVSNKDTDHVFYNLHAKRIEASFRIANWTFVSTVADEYMNDTVLKLPMYKETRETVHEVNGMLASSVIIARYVSADTIKESEYESAMQKLDSLIGKKVYVKNGKYHEEGEEGFTPTGKEEVYTMDSGWIHLVKYQIAANLEKSSEECAKHLSNAVNISDFMMNTAGFMLAGTYVELKEYAKAEAIAAKLYENNKESPDYFQIMSMIKRYRDKNFEDAIAIADEGLKVLKTTSAGEYLAVQYGHTLRMQRGLNYVMLGKYKEANDIIYECCYLMSQTQTDYSTMISVYPETWEICALTALEIGDEEVYKAMEENFMSEQYADKEVYEANLADYKAGTKSLAQLVESGRYDLI